MTDQTVQTTETLIPLPEQQDKVFIEDFLKFWFVDFELPTKCDTGTDGAKAIYGNIKASESWAVISGGEFDWQDYFLCRLNEGTYHAKHAVEFLDMLAGGSVMKPLNDLINDKAQTIRANSEFIKWIPTLSGRNTTYMVTRAAEQAKQYTEGNKYSRVWIAQLRNITIKMGAYKQTEVSGPEQEIRVISNKSQANLKRQRERYANLEFYKTKLTELDRRYLGVIPEPVNEIPSANKYKGKLVLELDAESIQKWASALMWFSDREELNRAIYQILLESGELIRDHTPFSEGKTGMVTIEKDGFHMGMLNYFLVCKACDKQGGGNCPDCGPCC